jgi:hypothetical protein
MLVSLHELMAPLTPLNSTVALPWLAPNPVPCKITVPVTGAAGGIALAIVGLKTVKATFALL